MSLAIAGLPRVSGLRGKGWSETMITWPSGRPASLQASGILSIEGRGHHQWLLANRGNMQRPWSGATEDALAAAGWSPARCERDMVVKWRSALEPPNGGFHMSEAARVALEEFGGIVALLTGPGEQVAQGGLVMDPTLAQGEEDRFAVAGPLVDGLFPMGESIDGHAFLGIDKAGVVFWVGDAIHRIGDNIYDALDSVLVGRRPA